MHALPWRRFVPCVCSQPLDRIDSGSRDGRDQSKESGKGAREVETSSDAALSRGMVAATSSSLGYECFLQARQGKERAALAFTSL